MTIFIPERRKRLRDLLKNKTHRGKSIIISPAEKFFYAPTDSNPLEGYTAVDADVELIQEVLDAIEPLLNYMETLENHIELIEKDL